jgi:hypothetical protein
MDGQRFETRFRQIEGRVLELERSLQTALAKLHLFERAFSSLTSSGIAADFVEKVAKCESNERIEVIENVLRGIHKNVSNLVEGTQRTESNISLVMERTEKLSCGLQRHGEFCDGLNESTVKRMTELEKSIAELRSRKADQTVLLPLVNQAVAGLSAQVKKLVALENRRRLENQGIHVPGAGCDGDDTRPKLLIGLEIADLNSGECGVKVVRVLPDSRSEHSGLRAGDVVQKVNDVLVSCRSNFRVTEFPAVLSVLRGKETLTLTIFEA